MFKFFNNLYYKIKRDKLLMIISIICSLIFLFDLFLVLFNLIQFIVLLNNKALVFGGFIGLNIFTIVINVVALGLIVFYYIFNRRQVSAKGDNEKSK